MSARRFLAAFVSVVVAASVVWGVPERAAASVGGPPPEVPAPPSVPVEQVVVRSAADPMPPAEPAPEVVWPEGGSAVIVLPSDLAGRGVQTADGRGTPGGLPVVLRAPGPAGLGEPVSPLRRRVVVADNQLVPEQVTVSVGDQTAAETLGVAGVVFRVSRADGGTEPGVVDLDVDYREFMYAYGADFGARLVAVSLPDCAWTTPAVAACQVQTELESTNKQADAVVTVPGLGVPPNTPGATGGVYAVVAGASSPAGTFTATPLAPSSEWSAGNQGGDFGWSYPLRVPPVPGGLSPSVAFAYSSGMVDGRTLSTNSQPSWVGEGFELPLGYVERTYKSCRDDGQTIDDLCFWNPNEVTLVLHGRAMRLVRDPVSLSWFEKVSSGLRIEQLSGPWSMNETDGGEHWRVTTQDGTQYWFGTDITSTQRVDVFGDDSGEPCHTGSLAASHCWLAYRWNLRRVVDPRNNRIEIFWREEQNKYGRYRNTAAAEYDLEAMPVSIEYGYQSGSQPAAKVVFERDKRCFTAPCDQNTVAGRANWKDTPWDLNCSVLSGSCPGKYAPSFWSRNRLVAVSTQLRNAGGGYDIVDRWALGQYFPPTGDGTSEAMWFSTLTQTSQVGGAEIIGGAVTYPVIEFGGPRMANRVDTSSTAVALNKYRLGWIKNGAGGQVSVAYYGADCSVSDYPVNNAHSNSRRCFPQYAGTRFGWFHKYIVRFVTNEDLTGAGVDDVYQYFYSTGGTDTAVLWAYDPNAAQPDARRSWSQWRGYSAVTTWHGGTTGEITATDRLFYRGLDGDRANPAGQTRIVKLEDSQSGGYTLGDHRSLQGVLREETTRDGPGASTTLDSTIHEHTVIATFSFLAHRVSETKTRARTWLANASAYRWTETQTTVDGYGLPTLVKDLGDTATTGDDVCTTITYARDPAAFKVSYQAQTTTTDCAASPVASSYLAGQQIFYDGQATLGAPPTRGLPTKTTVLADVSGSTLIWAQAGRADYDSTGRVVEEYDALDNLTTTAYSPNLGPTTSVSVTNPAMHVTTATLKPAWGLTVKVEDPNLKTTTLAYDASGRLLKVWLPGRSLAATPNVEYAYLLRANGANAVTTKTLGPTGAQIVSTALHDGLFRPRQTQTPVPGGGRAIVDTRYNDRGLVAKTTAFFNATSGPVTDLAGFQDTDVDRQTTVTYDPVERPVISMAKDGGVELWRTSLTYDGDRITLTPPTGGTATTSIVDARGQRKELRQYLAPVPTGTYDTTTYAYDRLGQLTSITDPVGNQWDYTYDRRGRQVTVSAPDTGDTSRTFDDAGRMTSSTDNRGTTIAYVYDDLGRLVERRDSSPTGNLRASWEYDTLAKGQLTKAHRKDALLTYTNEVTQYDDAYRPLQARIVIPGDVSLSGLSGTYQYDATYNVDGSVNTQALPALGSLPAETLTSTYDTVGRLKTLTGLTTYLADVSYDWDGQITQQTLGSGTTRVKLTTAYDQATGRLRTNQVHTEHPGTPNTWDEVVTEQYRHFDVGTLKSLVEQHGGVTTSAQCFTYDYLQRLAEAWTNQAWNCVTAPSAVANRGPDPYWTSWTIDKVGNRTQQTAHATGGGSDAVTNYAYPVAGADRPHAVTGTTGANVGSFTYDDAGNTITRNVGGTSQTLTWDPEGHLATHTINGQASSYLYDADGTRLIRRDPSNTTVYLLDGELRRSSGGTITATRYYPHAIRTGATTVTWTAGDHHGTQQTAIRASDLQVTRRLTMPYGEPRGAQPAWPDDHGYLGAPTDTTGLTHLGAREYDPTNGRFISVDPVLDTADPQQMNGYAYASNNPTSASDPSGLLQKAESTGGQADVDRTIQVPIEACTWTAGVCDIDIDQTPPQKCHIVCQFQVTSMIMRTTDRLDCGLWCPVLGRDGGAAHWQQGAPGRPGIPGITPLRLPTGGPGTPPIRRGHIELDPVDPIGTHAATPTVKPAVNPTKPRTNPNCHSFAPDTEVLMADGTTRRIKDIKLGDQVLTTDPETGKTTPRPVTDTHENLDTELATITITDSAGETAAIHTTQNHPFWSTSAGQWVEAADLSPGETIASTTDEPAVVSTSHPYNGSQLMYDLTVADIHTYYVLAGNTPVLVHNTGDDEYLYRGVHYGHPGYEEALRGIATPWGGHDDPKLHNDGDNRSVFTSWTTDFNTALEFSREGGSAGVVLRVKASDVASQIVLSPDFYEESEVLLRGRVTGATTRLGDTALSFSEATSARRVCQSG